jgi:hypothetical protein
MMPLTRANIVATVNEKWRVVYPFEDLSEEGLSATEQVRLKNKVYSEVLKVMFVYSCNKLMLGHLHSILPDLKMESSEFSELYKYAMNTWSSTKSGILWKGYYVSSQQHHVFLLSHHGTSTRD